LYSWKQLELTFNSYNNAINKIYIWFSNYFYNNEIYRSKGLRILSDFKL